MLHYGDCIHSRYKREQTVSSQWLIFFQVRGHFYFLSLKIPSSSILIEGMVVLKTHIQDKYSLARCYMIIIIEAFGQSGLNFVQYILTKSCTVYQF